MKKLTDYTSYKDAQTYCNKKTLWALMAGNEDNFNISYECVDRHATNKEKLAITVVQSDGSEELITFQQLSIASSRFAHYLNDIGIKKGDRIALMLEPSFAFYTALFGSLKAGAIAVPLFTLFGPDAVKLRFQDCHPTLLVTTQEKSISKKVLGSTQQIFMDKQFLTNLSSYNSAYQTSTSSRDIAIYQYTSGTTRALPAAIKHHHGAIVTLLVAALYGTGLRPSDKFFCPSSPAWGHGLWHGTLAPLSLGISIGTYAGRFNADRLLAALSQHRFTNMSAAATHYRMMRNSPDIEKHRYFFEKLSFTGEPLDSDTNSYMQNLFNVAICSMYGTTEIGVILACYPGADDFVVKPGSLGKAVPGVRVEVHNNKGEPCSPNEIGEMKVFRHGQWIGTKDLGWVDEDRYFYHAGRADDVIISAGWTMSAIEIEDTLLKHPNVLEAAVIGVPDELRGQIVKAFIILRSTPNSDTTTHIQDFVRNQLSKHEYPRLVEYVDTLPKTPAGKINRKILRDRETLQAQSQSAIN